MPSAHTSSRNHPPQERRTFRGRGGPTDGNLPPKKTVRRRVKYQAVAVERSNKNTSTTVHDKSIDVSIDPMSDCIELQVQQLAINTINNETNDLQEEEEDDKLLLEINHLRKRIQHLILSFQTSQGLGNPSTWQSNCLLPTRKAVNEWRSIVKYYNLHDVASQYYFDDDTHDNRKGVGAVGDCDEGEMEGAPTSQLESQINQISLINKNNNVKETISGDTMDIIYSTTQEVFSLLQTSIQVGPLSGSNPGYFKRCGSEVATMALTYLSDIADNIATVDNSSLEQEDVTIGVDKNTVDGASNSCIVDGAPHSYVEGEQLLDGCGCDDDDINSCQYEDEDDDESVESDNDCILSDASKSSSESEQDDYDDDVDNDAQLTMLTSDNASSITSAKKSLLPPPSIAELRRLKTINNLQLSFLFTEKQSNRFYQWMINAENASRKNRPPSKSAVKLQSLKSKKQKQKEMKMERKMKKKKKGGGG